jgi:aminoglycoside 2'-N-acetyltransferase I
VQRHLVLDDRPLRTGYVEGVAVDADHRGRGHAAAVMAVAEGIVRAGYRLGALSASGGVERFYLSRGWLAWQGPTYVLSPAGMTRTPADDDSMYVLPVSAAHPVRVTGTLACDWRAGDVW